MPGRTPDWIFRLENSVLRLPHRFLHCRNGFSDWKIQFSDCRTVFFDCRTGFSDWKIQFSDCRTVFFDCRNGFSDWKIQFSDCQRCFGSRKRRFGTRQRRAGFIGKRLVWSILRRKFGINGV